MFTRAERPALIWRTRVRLRQAAGTDHGDHKVMKELRPIAPWLLEAA